MKAAAHSSKASFLSLNGAEIYSPFLGASESIIRDTFKQARAMQPCLVFIDEIEAVVGKREENQSESSGIQQRILSTLLNELDGVGTADGQAEGTHVILVAATNRPDRIDSALLRPGRLDQLVYVPRPSSQERTEILRVKASRLPLAQEIDLQELSALCEGFTGADLENLCREAALISLQENIHSIQVVSHFESDCGFVNLLPKNLSHFTSALAQLKDSASLVGTLGTDDTYIAFMNNSQS